jgi:hypothetical protein
VKVSKSTEKISASLEAIGQLLGLGFASVSDQHLGYSLVCHQVFDPDSAHTTFTNN